MSDIISDLKAKKKQIETLQRQKDQQEGERKQLLRRLKDECGVDSVEDCQKKINKLGEDLVENEKLLEDYKVEMDTILAGANSET